MHIFDCRSREFPSIAFTNVYTELRQLEDGDREKRWKIEYSRWRIQSSRTQIIKMVELRNELTWHQSLRVLAERWLSSGLRLIDVKPIAKASFSSSSSSSLTSLQPASKAGNITTQTREH